MRTLFDFLADTGRPAVPAMIALEKDSFRLTAEIYAWGKIRIRLAGCSLPEGDAMPQDAFLLRRFCAQKGEGQYAVQLTYFPFDCSEAEAVTLSFTCRELAVNEQLLRYTEHAGLPGAALLREQTAMFSVQLLTKAFALDEDGLTPEEQSLLDGAWLAVMNAPAEYADVLAALYGEDALERESRIREIRACAQIENSAPLREAIEAFHQADEIGDTRALRRAQAALFQIFENPALPELHAFYHRLFDGFLQANEAFPPRREAEGTAVCLQFLDVFLQNAGFSGQFPHYRRQRGQQGEYLSLAWSLDLLQETPTALLHVVGGTAQLERDSLGPIPFAQSNAFDCEWHTAQSRCAILGAFSTLAQEKELLAEALAAFDGKALPAGRKIVPLRAVCSYAGVGALIGAGAGLAIYGFIACALFVGKLMGRTARWLLLTQLRFWGAVLLAAAVLGALAAVLYLYHISRYPLGRRPKKENSPS